MKTTILFFSTLALALAGVTGCAHNKTEANLDEKITTSSQVNTTKDLRDEASAEIAASPNLTPEQKMKLTELQQTVRTQFDEMHKQSLQLRSVLIKDVIDPKYNAKEVALIKKRLKDVETKRLSLLFKTVDDANAIMGRNAQTNGKLIGRIIEPTGVGRFQ